MALSLPPVCRHRQIKSALQTLSATLVSHGGTAVTPSSSLPRKQQGALIAAMYANARALGASGTMTTRRYPSVRRVRSQLLALETIIGQL
jgi:hypothetical protein